MREVIENHHKCIQAACIKVEMELLQKAHFSHMNRLSNFMVNFDFSCPKAKLSG